MKMIQKLLHKASVFFLATLLLLTGCGIATYFYVISAVTAGSDSIDSVSGSYAVSNYAENLSLITVGGGPGLLLCYTVTDSANTPSSISTAFSSQYIRNNNGIAVTNDLVLESTSNHVYQFSDSTGTKFRAPGYVLLADNPTSVDISFKLQRAADSSDSSLRILNLSVTNGSYSMNGTGELRRYNGTSFPLQASTIIANPDSYPDYQVSETSKTLYLHVFAAMSITEGSFSNIYWTQLVHLGYIELT
jgi:hypothetical protein